MPVSKSLSDVAGTLSQISKILDKGPTPSPHGESAPAPPPTPEYTFPSSPDAEDGEVDRVHPEADNPTALSPDSISGLRSSAQRTDGRIGSRGGAPLLTRLTPTLVLENSGSVARDHLASERTFLAYVRTSLAIATAGVALVQLFTVASGTNSTSLSATVRQIHKFARPLGATMVAFGLAVLALGVYRYFVIQASLTKGLFPITRFGIAGITAILSVVVITVFAILVSGRS